jgi:hypothetical protein
MRRWMRFWTALGIIMALVAAAATETIRPAGLGRADVCADPQSGQQYEAVDTCTEPGAAAPFSLPSPEYVSPPSEFILPPFAVLSPNPNYVPPQQELIPSPPRPERHPHPAPAPVWTTTDPMDPSSQLPSGNLPGGRYEVGTYLSSDNLRIYGLICYPSSPGPHPVLILNPGLGGINTYWFNGCANLAAAGWLVAASAYRGEPIGPFPPIAQTSFTAASPGSFEFCGGEVDDSLSLLAAVKALPNNVANPSQVVMYGHSLGSCVTELAIERLGRGGGAAPQIAVSLDGPTDFTFTTWQVLHAPGPPPSGYGAAWCDSCGGGGPGPGTPEQQLQQLTARSSAFSGNNPQTYLASPNLAFLRIHDTGDTVVAPGFGCELAAALGPGSSNYFLYPETSPPGTYVAPPKECAPWPTSWKLGQLLPDTGKGGPWTSPTFLMYECPHSVCTGALRSPQAPPAVPVDEGVIEHVAIAAQAWNEVASFVNHFASGWSASFPPQFPFM